MNIKFKDIRLNFKLLLLFIVGVMMALALPPVNAFPILWLSFPVLYFAIEAAVNKKQAFCFAWVFGTGFCIASLYWISFALFVDIAEWWWLIPFSLLLGPSILAIYTGLFGVVLFQLFKYFTGISRVLLFSALWGVFSYLQGYLFTGFPWNLIGYTWIGSIAVAQNLSWLGIYGLTLVTVFCAALPVLRNKQAVILSVLIPMIMWGWGNIRLSNAEASKFNSDILLRVVQGGIPQVDKWKAEKQLNNLNTYLDYSNAPSEIKPTHIIWPETALTTDITKYSDAGEYIRGRLPKDTIFLTGNIRQDEKGFYNSLLVMDVNSGDKAYYDKTHLVPFGEYVPFREVFSFGAIGAAISGIADFQRGTGPYTIKFENTPAFSSLICYEIIFPSKVTAKNQVRPEWLLNVTNDGWYGNTSGPYQHLALSQARAIEEGLPVIRAAGTGISAVIDAYGRVLSSISLGEAGVIDMNLPHKINKTIYAFYGNITFWLLVLLSIILSILFRHFFNKKP